MMTAPVSKNDTDQVLSDAYQEGHGAGYKAARARFEHATRPLDLAIMGASFGIGASLGVGVSLAVGTGLLWLIG